MTTVEHPSEVASAAASGASATERFHADKSPFDAVKDAFRSFIENIPF